MVEELAKGYSKGETGAILNVRAGNMCVSLKAETISVSVKVKGLAWKTFLFY